MSLEAIAESFGDKVVSADEVKSEAPDDIKKIQTTRTTTLRLEPTTSLWRSSESEKRNRKLSHCVQRAARP